MSEMRLGFGFNENVARILRFHISGFLFGQSFIKEIIFI